MGNYTSARDLVYDQGVSIVNWFHFSDFQQKLISEFSLILVGNLFLIFLAWRVYGKTIVSRSKGGRRVIEELRVSMSELQLPNDYDFKYK